MTDFITSDLHFGHPNIMKFCPNTRKFQDVHHMNGELIRMWNAEVQPTDTVYILGDISFADVRQTVETLKALNGRKILIEGNHDKKMMRETAFRAQFAEIHKYHEIQVSGVKVVMFHYPIAEWDQCHRGSVHFHGHLHQNNSGLEHLRARNVGFDYTGKLVWKLNDAIADALKGEIKGHGG